MTQATATMRQKRQAVQEWMVGASCRVCLLFLVIVLGIMYILEASAMSTQGFEMGDLQRNISALQHENQNVEVEIANYRSLKSIQERLKRLQLVEATDAEYVNVVGTAVARR